MMPVKKHAWGHKKQNSPRVQIKWGYGSNSLVLKSGFQVILLQFEPGLGLSLA